MSSKKYFKQNKQQLQGKKTSPKDVFVSRASIGECVSCRIAEECMTLQRQTTMEEEQIRDIYAGQDTLCSYEGSVDTIEHTLQYLRWYCGEMRFLCEFAVRQRSGEWKVFAALLNNSYDTMMALREHRDSVILGEWKP